MPKIKDFKQKLLLTIVYVGLIYTLYQLNIGCIFLSLLKIPCPGCGITRALIAVLSLDFHQAFSYHAMFWSLPILYLYFLFDGKLLKNSTINKIIFILITAGFILNWVLKIFRQNNIIFY